MDYKHTAQELIEKSGGHGNIKAVGHCATRLRFTLIDKNRADMEAIKSVDGVLGAIYATGQVQIVLGKELIPIYTAAVELHDAAAGKTGDSVQEPTDRGKKTPKELANAVVGFVAGAVSPLVPGLIGGGMLKVLLLLVTYAFPAFGEGSTYTILSWVANAPFYFMPIFVAYGAAKQLNSTPIYAMAGAASLITPEFVELVAAGESITMLNIPVRLVKYQQQLLPALLIAASCCYIEKLLNKYVPGIFKSIFVGMGTMGLSMVLGFTVLGPLGSYVGSAISGVFVWLGAYAGPLAVGILAGCMPWLVMTGMHHAVSPFMAQSIADPGYDPIFRPSFILHNMAEGGACLGVGLRTKDMAFRSEVFSLAFGCIVAGVTEPAIYGVNLKLKKPMYGVMAGGAVGGIVTGLLGARAYTMGYSTVMALPIFEDTIAAMVIGIVVTIVVAAAVTFLLGFEEKESAGNGKARAGQMEDEKSVGRQMGDEKSASGQMKMVCSPLKGKVVPLDEVDDPLFAEGVMGVGVGIEPEEGILYAPADGTVAALFPTGHAVGLQTLDGIELLLHIGINTVSMEGKGFRALVEQNAQVKAGDPLVEFDLAAIAEAGCKATTMVLVSNSDALGEMSRPVTGKVKLLDELYYFQ